MIRETDTQEVRVIQIKGHHPCHESGHLNSVVHHSDLWSAFEFKNLGALQHGFTYPHLPTRFWLYNSLHFPFTWSVSQVFDHSLTLSLLFEHTHMHTHTHINQINLLMVLKTQALILTWFFNNILCNVLFTKKKPSSKHFIRCYVMLHKHFLLSCLVSKCL